MSPEALPAEAAGNPHDPIVGVLPAADITIHVGNGVIFRTPLGGNAHVYRQRTQHAIRWHSDTPFTLEFKTFDDAGTHVWPFEEPQPAWPVRQFTGTPAAAEAPVYLKYSVSAGNLFLDPIVIVDK